jgi:hypothetical protein
MELLEARAADAAARGKAAQMVASTLAALAMAREIIQSYGNRGA